MRFRHRSGGTVLVSYCTNVHAARNLADVLEQLDRYGQPVREKVGWAELGLGLWLPAPVAAGLAADPADVARLRRELRARGLAVVTMNGFPYRDFHDRTVKKRVYRP